MSEATEYLADRVEDLSFWFGRVSKRLHNWANAIARWGRNKHRG